MHHDKTLAPVRDAGRCQGSVIDIIIAHGIDRMCRICVDTAVNFQRGRDGAAKSYGIGSPNDYVNRWVSTRGADELGGSQL